MCHVLKRTIPGKKTLDTSPVNYPLQKNPQVNPAAECSNILKAKIWKLALTQFPDPIGPTRRDVLTITDPQGLPLGVDLGGNLRGVSPGGICSYSYPLTRASFAGGVGRKRDSEQISGFTACYEPFQRQVQYTTRSDQLQQFTANAHVFVPEETNASARYISLRTFSDR